MLRIEAELNGEVCSQWVSQPCGANGEKWGRRRPGANGRPSSSAIPPHLPAIIHLTLSPGERMPRSIADARFFASHGRVNTRRSRLHSETAAVMIRPAKDSSGGLSISRAAIQPPRCHGRLLFTECRDWGRMRCTAREHVCLMGLEIRLIHRAVLSPDFSHA